MHEDKVEPAIELSADRPQMADLGKTEPRMQSQ